MELKTNGKSSISLGGDGAGGNITKTTTTYESGDDVKVAIKLLETRITMLEQSSYKKGIEEMVDKKILAFFSIGIFLVFMFVPTITSVFTPQPTSASFSVSPLAEFTDYSKTPSLQAPTVHKIVEWCLGESYGIGDELTPAINVPQGDIPCTQDENEFKEWLGGIGAQSAPVITFIITGDNATESATQNPILGVGFDCTNHNYGCSVIYFHTSNSNLNQNFAFGLWGTSWNDRISSYQKWLWHNAIHYENSGLAGASVTCTCYDMGIMDNEASSILFLNSP